MISFKYWARVGWLFLHLLLVALVCTHETAWLVGKQLTILPGVSARFWNEIDNVSETLIGVHGVEIVLRKRGAKRQPVGFFALRRHLQPGIEPFCGTRP